MTRRAIAVGLAVLAVLAGVAGVAGVALVRGASAGPAVYTVALGQTPTDMVVDSRTGRAFIATYTPSAMTGHVAVLDVGTGRLVRTVPVGYEPGPLAVDPAPGGHVFAVHELSVSMLDGRSGRLVRTVNTVPAGAVASTPGTMAIDARSHRLFVVNSNHTVSVLDTLTAALWGVFHVVGNPMGVAVDAGSGHLFVTTVVAAPALPAVMQGYTTMLDARSGHILRTVSIGPLPHEVIIAARARRVVVSNYLRNSVSMLDVGSGKLVQSVMLPGLLGPMALDKGTGHVFVATEGGRVFMLDARSGRILRTIAAGTYPAAIVADAARGRIYVVSRNVDWNNSVAGGPGSVLVLDGRSGNTLQSLAAGVAPLAAAMDERAGRLVVVNAGGAVQGRDAWGWLPAWLHARLLFVPHGAPVARTAPAGVSVFALMR